MSLSLSVLSSLEITQYYNGLYNQTITNQIYLSTLSFQSSSQTRTSDESSEKPANEDYENDTLDDVDQLLDDALEESYRSVLEEKSKNTSDSKMVRK